MPRRQGRCFHATASRVLPDRAPGRSRRPTGRARRPTGRARRRSPGRVRRQGDDDDLLRTHVTSGGELAIEQMKRQK